MAFWNRKKKRDTSSTSSYWLINSDEAFEKLCVSGYTPLDRIPAVIAGYRRIAELIGSMTIHLMANTENGDVRIKNELSRKIDVNPCSTMNRSQFIEYICMSMFLYGKGNAIVRVKTQDGYINDLQPIPADRFQLVSDETGYSYHVVIDGVPFNPDEVLHFVYNPDKHYPWKGQGVTVPLEKVTKIIDQASTTEKAFMESKWMPSVVVKVSALSEQFSTKEGRAKLIDEYLRTNEAGEPWIIPADQIDVQEIKPLTLSDLALNDSMTRNTKLIASLLGVPPFLLGEGDYNQKEWNNFVNNRLRPIVVSMQQELTRKLILSPKMYLKFNQRALFDYDLSMLATVYTSLQDRGDVTGNEVREIFGLSPADGLDELVRLENYIPADMAANQSKLLQGDEENANE